MPASTYTYPTGHTYRHPRQIARDMSEISRRIHIMEEKLNVRDLLVETLYQSEEAPSVGVIGIVEELLADTKETLARMASLRESLAMLEEELEVCRCHRV